MDIEKLKKAIAHTEEKVDFNCKKFPDRDGCEGCNEDCGMKNIQWNCHGDLRLFKEGLQIANVDDNSEYVQWSESHGGYCDCEVIFNAKEHLPEI